jgi:hypothetical protein
MCCTTEVLSSPSIYFVFLQDLISDMIRHYSGQAIKQAYVVIFGLDVIGNPFGLVVGVSRSLEDFFYEPFQVTISQFDHSELICSDFSNEKADLKKIKLQEPNCLPKPTPMLVVNFLS